MATYRDIRDIDFERTVVTVGNFDGIHSGHRLLLQRVVDLAAQNRYRSVILTFWPHPRHVLKPENEVPMLLNTLDEKLEMLNECGVDDVVVFPFDMALSQMPASGFVREIIIGKLKARFLVMGQDHHFGNDRSGDVQHLPEFAAQSDLQVEVVDLKMLNRKISSSVIRNALLCGDLELANAMLGYEYMISGKVIEGQRIGRTIGFPTANIETPEYKLLPKEGVYRVKVKTFDKTGMMYIGVKPGEKKALAEVNIFDFDRQIYGQEMTVALTHYIRENRQFENVEQLAEQLERDRQILNIRT